jgi:threonine dehydrogenase-like Zn-dependent dehydrogenase
LQTRIQGQNADHFRQCSIFSQQPITTNGPNIFPAKEVSVRALIFDGQHARLAPSRPDPLPQPGEALIRPLLLGICATDLEICRGYRGFTGVLGHEFVGIVEKAPGKEGAKLVGKRVVGTINCFCGHCDLCRAGLREHCRQRTVLGIAGRDGCFADRFTLPVANLFPVPDGLDDDHAVFAEPLAAAYQITRQLTIEGRPYITVLGDGRLGLLCAQVMSQLNATVRCVGKHPEKLGLCEKWGVKHRLLDDVGLRADQDIVVDATGSPQGLACAMKMVRPRGRIVLKTTIGPQPAAQPPVDLSPLVVNEINLIGSRCGPFPDALMALIANKIDVISLISRRMKLAEGVEALRLATQKPIIKVLLDL